MFAIRFLSFSDVLFHFASDAALALGMAQPTLVELQLNLNVIFAASPF